MTYLIPTDKIAVVEKQVTRIKNKGVAVVFEVGPEKYVEQKLSSGFILGVRCKEVEVGATYKIDDWSFIATIEHSDAGNIIRAIDFEKSIPEKYRSTGHVCEHCNKIRDRKDTYLIFNNKTNDFKQVGKTCLQDYTNGLDASVVAQLVDLFTLIRKFESGVSTQPENLYGGFLSHSIDAGLKTANIRGTIFSYVKSNGYVPKVTIEILGKIIFGQELENVTKVDENDIENVTEWVKNLKDTSSYIANAKVAWLKEYSEYRDLALQASLVSVYLKEKAHAIAVSQNTSNTFVGEIGDKIKIEKIKSIRVAYTSATNHYVTYMYEIIDAQGYTYIWSTAEPDLESKIRKIISISATIKGHREYKGTKQTVITRGKIEWEKLSDDALQTLKDKNSKSMADIYDWLNSIED